MFKSSSDAAITILILLAAAVCEVGGGWCIWKWRREGWHWGFFILGSIVLTASGLLPTLQTQEFARTYALYGGFFIALSFFWGWAWEGNMPDLWDGIGATITVIGVCIVMFVPRATARS